jgi:hypothetical protein
VLFHFTSLLDLSWQLVDLELTFLIKYAVIIKPVPIITNKRIPGSKVAISASLGIRKKSKNSY